MLPAQAKIRMFRSTEETEHHGNGSMTSTDYDE